MDLNALIWGNLVKMRNVISVFVFNDDALNTDVSDFGIEFILNVNDLMVKKHYLAGFHNKVLDIKLGIARGMLVLKRLDLH